MAASADRRVLFFGDSFVAGVGDPTGLGWVGRVVAASHATGHALTAYNLGVRGETSLQVAARWRAEARPRMAADATYGLVLAVGVNDTMLDGGRVRVEPALARDSLGRMLEDAARLGLRSFVVGPAPAGEAAHDARIGALSSSFAQLAAARGVPYVDAFADLRACDRWSRDVGADGVHPGAAGYRELARVVLESGWLSWLAEGRPES